MHAPGALPGRPGRARRCAGFSRACLPHSEPVKALRRLHGVRVANSNGGTGSREVVSNREPGVAGGKFTAILEAVEAASDGVEADKTRVVGAESEAANPGSGNHLQTELRVRGLARRARVCQKDVKGERARLDGRAGDQTGVRQRQSGREHTGAAEA